MPNEFGRGSNGMLVAWQMLTHKEMKHKFIYAL